MLATKNRVAAGFIFSVMLAVIFAGCAPSGPRALLDGKRLLDQGEYAKAVAKLKSAVTLLSTNAQAWNYLGVAYHRAGQTADAAAAYQRALALNRNLLEARFNLGCLRLEQNNADAAKAEFTAYTLQRPNVPEGWVKLGFAQLQDREIAAAEKSFSEAVRLDARNADAFNGIGLAQLQRNRPRDAAAYFAATLRLQPDHRAALLNQARVLQVNLNDPQGALEDYRRYLSLKPKPDNWAAVNEVAQALQKQLATPTRPAPPAEVARVVTNTPATNAPPTKPQLVAARQPEPEKPEPKPETKTEPAKPAPKPAETNAPEPAVPMEVVTVPPEPEIKTTPDVVPPPQTQVATVRDTNAVEPVVESRTVVSQPPEKRGFFQRLNPLNLFRREPKPAPKLTPLPAGNTAEGTARVGTNALPPNTVTAAQSSSPSLKQSSLPRYRYLSPSSPAAGNRADAEREFAAGVKIRDAGRLADAADLFRQSVKSDPAYFEAQFSLALAEFQLKEYKESLANWETALAIHPDSTDARYNFALALAAANYPVDAVNELEEVLAANPKETRAHLALGNLYAEQLGDKAKARTHYQKVLELSPNHPEAGAIRYWLVSNPQ